MKESLNNQSFSPYIKRAFDFHGIWAVGNTQLKVYTIRSSFWDDKSLPDLDTIFQYVSETLPSEVDKEGGDAGLGFVVVHFGDGHIWVLTHWWAHGEICCQRMSHSDVDQVKFKSVADRALHACVWENKVINHEHEAWIENMLTSEPREQAYLNNALSKGAY